MLRRYPFTIFFIVANTVIYLSVFNDPRLSQLFVEKGGLFNPLALGGEWHRLFTHLFLHGGFLHLLMNMYALFIAGSVIEDEDGSIRFLLIYFITGIAAAFSSLYWNLFVVGVGASGAIFGLFAYAIVTNVIYSLKQGLPIRRIIIVFMIFMGFNLVFAGAMNVDNAAHIGGFLCGALLAGLSLFFNQHEKKITIELAMAVVLIGIYFLLPRHQVSYYKMYQKILQIERAGTSIFDKKGTTDAEFLQFFEDRKLAWDSALTMLNDQPYVPEELQQDTIVLRRYISLGNLEAQHRTEMIRRESYVYYDSIELVQDSLRSLPPLQYPIAFGNSLRDEPDPEPEKSSALKSTTVYYDSNWVEIDDPPGVYFRIGSRDEKGKWQGPVRDYYANGDVQMKGTYKDDKKHGVFLYYSDHKTYTSSGRYVEDQNVGKWETFHDNGKPESEVYYNDGYFLKSLWDSSGNQMVKDGFGEVVAKHPSGTVASQGSYKNGKKEGYWFGRHPNGEMYFEENYARGRLVHGQSRNPSGKMFIYDESSFYPIPEGGHRKYALYLRQQTRKYKNVYGGYVKLSFRVTVDGVLTDFTVEEGISPEVDQIAKSIVRDGPRWIPAKEHGDKPVDGFAFVTVVFDE